MSDAGIAPLWQYEAHGSAGPVVPPANAAAASESVISALGKSWLYGDGGVFVISNAGAAQVSQAVTRLFLVGHVLYGYDSRKVDPTTIYVYARGAFQKFGHIRSARPAAPRMLWTDPFLLPVANGFLRGVVTFKVPNEAPKVVFEMYRLPG